MRRTHSTEQEKLKTDPRIVAKQQGHSMDVHYREYVQADTSELEEAATRYAEHEEATDQKGKEGQERIRWGCKLLERWSGRRESNSQPTAWKGLR